MPNNQSFPQVATYEFEFVGQDLTREAKPKNLSNKKQMLACSLCHYVSLGSQFWGTCFLHHVVRFLVSTGNSRSQISPKLHWRLGLLQQAGQNMSHVHWSYARNVFLYTPNNQCGISLSIMPTRGILHPKHFRGRKANVLCWRRPMKEANEANDLLLRRYKETTCWFGSTQKKSPRPLTQPRLTVVLNPAKWPRVVSMFYQGSTMGAEAVDSSMEVVGIAKKILSVGWGHQRLFWSSRNTQRSSTRLTPHPASRASSKRSRRPRPRKRQARAIWNFRDEIPGISIAKIGQHVYVSHNQLEDLTSTPKVISFRLLGYQITANIYMLLSDSGLRSCSWFYYRPGLETQLLR